VKTVEWVAGALFHSGYADATFKSLIGIIHLDIFNTFIVLKMG